MRTTVAHRQAGHRRIVACALVPDLHAGFGGIDVALLFLFGLTGSRVLGFIGLSRLLVTPSSPTMAILCRFSC